MINLDFPWALILLPIPFIIWSIKGLKSPPVTRIRTPLFTRWQAFQTQQSAPQNNRVKQIVSSLIWCLLCLSVAKPVWISEAIELPISGRDLLLSIDISGSMQEQDLELEGQPVDRLEVVKSIVTQFIGKRQGDRLGLVLFGEKAYLQTPLTFDLKTVQYMLDETEIGLAGASRTAIGDGIGLAVKRLRERAEKNRVLILLTDGRNNSGELDPIEAAKLAKHAGVKIYTIGVGADEVIRRTLFGARKINPSAELDEATLTEVAQMTGGEYFRARSTEQLSQIYQLLDKLEPVEDKPEVYRPVTDLFHWPLSLAILLLLVPTLFRLAEDYYLLKRTDSNQASPEHTVPDNISLNQSKPMQAPDYSSTMSGRKSRC